MRNVALTANPIRPEDWTLPLRVLDEHNEEIVRTSIPFEYEPLDHPRLKKLREEYKLDEVVQGAHTELELMLRLANGAAIIGIGRITSGTATHLGMRWKS